MATYLIGDIQGCAGAFSRLLALIHPNWSKDSIWIAGDLINRGPDSLGVLRKIRALHVEHPNQVRIVLGNHDIHLLMTYYGLTYPRRGDTLEPIFAAEDREELIEWLTHQPLLQRQGQLIMVHAGLLPCWTEDQAEALSHEVHLLMRKDARTFLAHAYGNYPDKWQDDLEGIDRYRVILNSMTRLRFCTPQGLMEFYSKGQPHDAPEGFIPWYEAPHARHPDTTIAFGHWSQLGLRKMPGFISLDSGCLWRGPLTAIRVEDGHIFQVPQTEFPSNLGK
ncbi:MAG: symmetrical bis(5'-nucleosyl)-tetraphosphatase [Pseudomonadota bacterium]